MSDYANMKKDELQDLCRRRRLPISGTNEELVARLSGWDAAHDEDDLLAAVGQPPPREGAITVEPDEIARPPVSQSAPAPAPQQSTTPAGSDGAASKVFEMLFECPGALPTEMHYEWIERTARLAQEAGVATRGGAYRDGYRMKNGKRHAVYKITRARQ